MTETTPDHNLRPRSPNGFQEKGSQDGTPNGSPEKHGSLFGGALTEETLASSHRVLSRARGNEHATVGRVTA